MELVAVIVPTLQFGCQRKLFLSGKYHNIFPETQFLLVYGSHLLYVVGSESRMSSDQNLAFKMQPALPTFLVHERSRRRKVNFARGQDAPHIWDTISIG